MTMTKTDEEALKRAVSVLREVIQQLVEGVEKAKFEERYRGKFVSPGVTVGQYVRQLRLSGNLEETGSKMRLKQLIPA